MAGVRSPSQNIVNWLVSLASQKISTVATGKPHGGDASSLCQNADRHSKPRLDFRSNRVPLCVADPPHQFEVSTSLKIPEIKPSSACANRLPERVRPTKSKSSLNVNPGFITTIGTRKAADAQRQGGRNACSLTNVSGLRRKETMSLPDGDFGLF